MNGFRSPRVVRKLKGEENIPMPVFLFRQTDQRGEVIVDIQLIVGVAICHDSKKHLLMLVGMGWNRSERMVARHVVDTGSPRGVRTESVGSPTQASRL